MPAILSLAFLLFTVLLPAAPPARPKATAPVSDTAVEQSIRARFAKSKISADHFAVRVQGGVATIEGSTSVIQRKGAATRLAKLGGAKAVDNRIRISDAARQKAAESLKKQTQKPAQKPQSSGKPQITAPAPQTTASAAPPTPPDSTPKSLPRAQVKH